MFLDPKGPKYLVHRPGEPLVVKRPLDLDPHHEKLFNEQEIRHSDEEKAVVAPRADEAAIVTPTVTPTATAS